MLLFFSCVMNFALCISWRKTDPLSAFRTLSKHRGNLKYAQSDIYFTFHWIVCLSFNRQKVGWGSGLDIKPRAFRSGVTFQLYPG